MRLSVRHLESEYRFHVVGLDLQCAIVALCDLGGDEESQAQPLAAWTIIAALERHEKGRHLVVGDLITPVSNGERETILSGTGFDLDRQPLRTMSYRICE